MVDLRECERQRDMLEQGRGRGIMRSLVADALEDARQRVSDRLDELMNLLSLPVEYNGENQEEVLEAIAKATAAPRVAEGNENPAAAEVSRVQDIGQAVREWMVIAGRTNDFRRLIVEQSNVVGATCSFSGVRELEDMRFEWAIIDEAGRATVPEVLIPIVKAERAILVGDERQLPPMVEGMMDRESDNISGDHRLETSLFQSLVEQAEEGGHGHLTSLRTQYRMHTAIGSLIGDVFYEGRLGERASTETRGLITAGCPPRLHGCHIRVARPARNQTGFFLRQPGGGRSQSWSDSEISRICVERQDGKESWRWESSVATRARWNN